MLQKYNWLAIALLGAALPSTALATVTVNMPFTGLAAIGIDGGRIRMGTTRDGGASCEWKTVSPSSEIMQDTVINGTNGHDAILVATSTTTFCGVSLAPLLPSLLRLFGHGGNDIIHGGFAALVVDGGAGNDSLQSDRPFFTAVGGGDGNDVVSTRSVDGVLQGGSGDDIACVLNANRVAAELDGGPHSTVSPGDRRCGRGSARTVGWETSSCAHPCF